MTMTSTALAPALSGWAPPSTVPAAVRSVAATASMTADGLEASRRRLRDFTERLALRWSGAAGDAALDALARRHDDLVALQGVYEDAAEVLVLCARAVEDAHGIWRRAEVLERQDERDRASRAARLGAGEFVGPYELDRSPLREQARRLAQEARDVESAAVARAAAALHELSARMPREDEARRRPLTAADQLRGVGRGAVDAVWGSVVTLAGLSLPRLVVDPAGWLEHVQALGDGVAYAIEHPGAAAASAVGVDQLRAGKYGEWIGSLVPDVVGAVLSGGAVPIVRRGGEVAGELEELADQVDDLQRVTRVADAGGPVEVRDGVELPSGYVAVIADLTPDRRRHILDGDPPDVNDGKGGGHRSGTGKTGKTEFPAHWSDERIILAVMETARRPDAVVLQSNGRFRAMATHDGVTVEVAVSRDGSVVTAYPSPGGRGVVRNP